jgi:hypothetical protein
LNTAGAAVEKLQTSKSKVGKTQTPKFNDGLEVRTSADLNCRFKAHETRRRAGGTGASLALKAWSLGLEVFLECGF